MYSPEEFGAWARQIHRAGAHFTFANLPHDKIRARNDTHPNIQDLADRGMIRVLPNGAMIKSIFFYHLALHESKQ